MRTGALLALVLLTPAATAQSTVRPALAHYRWFEWSERAVPLPAAGGEDATRTADVPGDREGGPIRERGDGPEAEPVPGPGPGEDPEPGDDPRTFAGLDLTGVLLGRTTDGAGGSLATQRAGWRAIVGERDPDGSGVLLRIASEASFYDFGTTRSPLLGPAADPLNDVYETSVGVDWTGSNADGVATRASLEVNLSGEDLVSPGDALTYGVLVGFAYRHSERFALHAGLAGRTRIEEEAWVFPYLGFEVALDEASRTRVEGPEVRLDVGLGGGWSAGLHAAYDVRQYRLNDANPVPEGVLDDEEIRLGGELRFTTRSGIGLGLEAGRVIWRELGLRTAEGDGVDTAELEHGGYLGLTVRLGF